MAFDRMNLNKHADFDRHRMFHYKTPDAHTAVSASGYFNDAVKNCGMEDGDVIVSVGSVGGTKSLRMYVVSVDATTKVATTAQLSVS
jgi:hypothetical protein